MKSPNAVVLSRTAVVRSRAAGSLQGNCRTIEFRADAEHPQGIRGVDYATADRLISLKATHRISVQQAVAQSG